MIIWCQECNDVTMEMGPRKEVNDRGTFHHEYKRPLCMLCARARFGWEEVSA